MQPTRETLLALRERVLAAMGADSVLDRGICIALGLEPWTGSSAKWEPEQVMAGSQIDRATPKLTASADAILALIDGDPAYRADPEYFLTQCMVRAPARNFDYTKPAAPQAARHMLASYLGAKAALASQEATHV